MKHVLKYRPLAWLTSLEAVRPFSEREAWLLFRLAAYGEAAGWSLLIIGILLRHYLSSHTNVPVLIAGQIHGTLFLLYFVAALVLYPSLYWSRKRAFLAIAASVPPFGSLVFEQWAAHQRRRQVSLGQPTTNVRAIILRKGKVLALQWADKVDWSLPGGALEVNESPGQACKRLVREQTGIVPELGVVKLSEMVAPKGASTPTYYYEVRNGLDFTRMRLRQHAEHTPQIETIMYLDPSEQPLVPDFVI